MTRNYSHGLRLYCARNCTKVESKPVPDADVANQENFITFRYITSPHV